MINVRCSFSLIRSKINNKKKHKEFERNLNMYCILSKKKKNQTNIVSTGIE